MSAKKDDYSWMNDRDMKGAVAAIEFPPPKKTGKTRELEGISVKLLGVMCQNWREQLKTFCREFEAQHALEEYADMITTPIEDTDLQSALRTRLQELGYEHTLCDRIGGQYTR